MDLGYGLATLNASLNGLAAILLFIGWRAIRNQKEKLHKKLMGSAFAVSLVFLISYLTRLFISGTHRYPGEGAVKTLYFVILASHVVLAALVPFLAIITIYFALKRRLSSHRKIAQVTFPIWMYVSVTGVVIYIMLYHFSGIQLGS